MRLTAVSFLLIAACAHTPDMRPVLDTDHELEDLTGTDYVRGMLLDRLSAAVPHDSRLQAEIAARRCVLARQYTPATAPQVCAAALSAAIAVQDRVLISAALRRAAQAERQTGHCNTAMPLYAQAADVAPPDRHVDRAQIAWGRALCFSAAGEHAEAAVLIGQARQEINAAGPGAQDYHAIIDLHAGQIAAAANDKTAACTHLSAARARQIKLKAESPEYAGYEHYYARIVLAQIRTGCVTPDVLIEVQRIAADLLRHDPRRVEYQELLRQVQ